MSHGAAANKSGKVGNETVAAILAANGVRFRREYKIGETGVLGEEIKVDFLIPDAIGYECGLLIEVRLQQGGGSVDKKIVALIHNIKIHYGKPTILVIDGAAVEQQRAFALGQVGGNLRAVYSLGEFTKFASSLSEGAGKAFVQKGFNPDQGSLFSRH